MKLQIIIIILFSIFGCCVISALDGFYYDNNFNYESDNIQAIITNNWKVEEKTRFITCYFRSNGRESDFEKFLQDEHNKNVKFILTQDLVYIAQCTIISSPIIEIYSYPHFNRNYKLSKLYSVKNKPQFFNIDSNLDKCFSTKCRYILKCNSKGVKHLEFIQNDPYDCFDSFYNADFSDNNITYLNKKKGILTYVKYLVKINFERNPIRTITSDAFKIKSLRFLLFTNKFTEYLNITIFQAILFHNKNLVSINCSYTLDESYFCFLFQKCDQDHKYCDIAEDPSYDKYEFHDVNILQPTENITNGVQKSDYKYASLKQEELKSSNTSTESSYNSPLIFIGVIFVIFLGYKFLFTRK